MRMMHEIIIEKGSATKTINKKAPRTSSEKMHLAYRRPVREIIRNSLEYMKEFIFYFLGSNFIRIGFTNGCETTRTLSSLSRI
jgi:hypothetical protein